MHGDDNKHNVKNGKKMQEKIKMHERNKNKMQGAAGSNMGVQELKQRYWAKKRERRCWALERVNRTGLVQVNQTGSGLII